MKHISQIPEKASQNFCVSKNILINILCQGVYLAQNTSQAASVEFGRQWQPNYARSRLPNLAEKAEGLFRQARIVS